MSTSEKIVENLVGKQEDGIVEKTTKKTIHDKNQATSSKEIVDNIL